MRTKCTHSHYSIYLTFCASHTSSVHCITFSIVCWISWKAFIDKLCLGTKLWNFKVQQVVKFYVHIRSIFSCQITPTIYISNIHYTTYVQHHALSAFDMLQYNSLTEIILFCYLCSSLWNIKTARRNLWEIWIQWLNST